MSNIYKLKFIFNNKITKQKKYDILDKRIGGLNDERKKEKRK